jgi:hypothetical protein
MFPTPDPSVPAVAVVADLGMSPGVADELHLVLFVLTVGLALIVFFVAFIAAATGGRA